MARFGMTTSFSCVANFLREQQQQAEQRLEAALLLLFPLNSFHQSSDYTSSDDTLLGHMCQKDGLYGDTEHGNYSSSRPVTNTNFTCAVNVYIPHMDFINSTRMRQGEPVTLLHM